MPSEYEFTPEQVDEVRRLYASGVGYRRTADQVGAPRKSVHRLVQRLGMMRVNREPAKKGPRSPLEALAELLPLPDPVEPQQWRSAGLCFTEGHDPNLWFPEVGDRHNKADTTRPICHRCPALRHCAAYALADSTLEGMWGGLTHNERRVILRAQRAEEAS